MVIAPSGQVACLSSQPPLAASTQTLSPPQAAAPPSAPEKRFGNQCGREAQPAGVFYVGYGARFRSLA
jgi:hypothetical protein